MNKTSKYLWHMRFYFSSWLSFLMLQYNQETLSIIYLLSHVSKYSLSKSLSPKYIAMIIWWWRHTSSRFWSTPTFLQSPNCSSSVKSLTTIAHVVGSIWNINTISILSAIHNLLCSRQYFACYKPFDQCGVLQCKYDATLHAQLQFVCGCKIPSCRWF